MRILGACLTVLVAIVSVDADAQPRTARSRPKAAATAKPSPTPTPPAFDCEAVKERLAGMTAACPEEARAAAALPCSATGHSRILKLELSCARVRDPKGAKKSPLAAEVGSGECRALAMVGGAKIAEANEPDYQACARAVQAKVIEAGCKPGVAAVEYLFLRGGQEPYATSVPCPGAP